MCAAAFLCIQYVYVLYINILHTYSRNNILNRKGREQLNKTITHQLWPICTLNSADTVRCWHIPQSENSQKSVRPRHYKLYDSLVHDFRRAQRIISDTYSFPYFTRSWPIELTPCIKRCDFHFFFKFSPRFRRRTFRLFAFRAFGMILTEKPHCSFSCMRRRVYASHVTSHCMCFFLMIAIVGD